jgi:hypothetical protein
MALNLPRPRELRLQRTAESLFVFFSCALSAFLYAHTFEEAHTFFAAQSGSFITEKPWIPLLAVVSLGWFLLWRSTSTSSLRWIAHAYLAVGSACAAYAALAPAPLYSALAFLVLVPAWVRLPAWTRDALRPRVLRVGSVTAWAGVAGVIALSIWITILAQGFCVLLRYPDTQFTLAEVSGIAARLTAYASLAAAVLVGGCLLVRLLVGEGRRAVLGSIALGVMAMTAALGVVALNAIRSIALEWRAPAHILFALAFAAPPAVLTMRNVARAEAPDLASAITGYASGGLGRAPQLSAALASDSPLARAVVPLAAFGAVLALQWTIGGWHMVYGWGSGTALLYNLLAIGSTAYLLTVLRPSGQRLALLAAFAAGVVAASSAAIWPVSESTWTAYVKFDKQMSLSRSLYHRVLPDRRPDLVRLRKEIERSAAYRDVDLSGAPRLRLATERPSERRPDVIVLVVDSLRADAYDARSPGDLAGLALLRDRFVSYTNAWTSYNCTAGSLPALFGGALTAAWFRAGASSHVRHANALESGLKLAGYRIFNAGNYLDLQQYWSERGEPLAGPGGLGHGDPAHVLPQVAARARSLRGEEARPPFLMYAHLYNLHQPLLKRPGAPEPQRGIHWMRAMYEHNVVHLDKAIHGLLSDLDEANALDDTIIVVTSDHGEELYDMGGLYHGWQLNPYVLKVPLYVHYPRGARRAPPPGTEVSEPVNLIDITPTVLGMAGVAVGREHEGVQGVDLREVADHPPRTFPALSWQTREAGLIKAHPPEEVLVVDAVSGRLEVFGLRGGRWRVMPSDRDAADVSRAVGDSISAIYAAWDRPERWTGFTAGSIQ